MRTRSAVYWRERAERLERDIRRGANVGVNAVIAMYERAFAGIDRDIRKAVQEFAKLSGLPEGAAEQYISQADKDKLYRDLLALMDEAPDAARKAKVADMINAQAYGARISRLEAVKLKAYIHLQKVAGAAAQRLKAVYAEAYKEARYRTVYDAAKGLDCGISFGLIPERAIEKVIEAPFHGKNYSERIWDNTAHTAKQAQRIITEGLIKGESYPRMARKLEAAADNTYYNAYRLIQTDTGHYLEEGRFDAYREIGVQKYRYCATLGAKTCEVCAALDGRTFLVSDRRESQNAPKMHPHCMCYTIIDDVELTSRIVRDPLTGRNYKVDGSVTYRQWYDGLDDEQRAAIKAYQGRRGDAKQYRRYVERLGTEHVPETLEKFQKMKYNRIDEWNSLKKQYREEKYYLQEQLSYILPTGEKGFIPNKAVITAAKAIAGGNSGTALREAERLAEFYGGKSDEWLKNVGKIESEKYIFDVHWYERHSKQFEMKLKRRSDKLK